MPPVINMDDILPKMHICENCGFMSTRGSEFDVVDEKKLCSSCAGKADISFDDEANGFSITGKVG
jgi:formylmethanofuran dehydrogenase subunit E